MLYIYFGGPPGDFKTGQKQRAVPLPTRSLLPVSKLGGPCPDALHDHVDSHRSDIERQDSTGDLDIPFDDRFPPRSHEIVKRFEGKHQHNGGQHCHQNDKACAYRIMPFPNDDTGADRAWPDQHGHGYRAREMLGFAAKNLDRRRATKDELNPDKEEDHTAKNLKGCEFRLQNPGKDDVTQNGKAAKNCGRDQSSPAQNERELSSLQFLNHVDQIDDDQERI